MELRFKNLTSDMADEFFQYFEKDAFPKDDSRMECYCLESHLKDENKYINGRERRKIARELIQKGIMTGFLIYEGDQAVGWCNAGDKMNYAPICENVDFMTPNMEKGQIKILYCMDIADGWQGRGIANLIMEKFLDDAEKEGYSYVEGYPFLDKMFKWQYRGPVKLYEKYGFEKYGEGPWFYIMRKKVG